MLLCACCRCATHARRCSCLQDAGFHSMHANLPDRAAMSSMQLRCLLNTAGSTPTLHPLPGALAAVETADECSREGARDNRDQKDADAEEHASQKSCGAFRPRKKFDGARSRNPWLPFRLPFTTLCLSLAPVLGREIPRWWRHSTAVTIATNALWQMSPRVTDCNRIAIAMWRHETASLCTADCFSLKNVKGCGSF